MARLPPRRLDAAVYRRRRLIAASAMVAVIGIAVAVAAGAADQALGERGLALVVFAAWVRACVAFARWDRRPDSSRAESRVSCLALDSAPAR